MDEQLHGSELHGELTLDHDQRLSGEPDAQSLGGVRDLTMMGQVSERDREIGPDSAEARQAIASLTLQKIGAHGELERLQRWFQGAFQSVLKARQKVGTLKHNLKQPTVEIHPMNLIDTLTVEQDRRGHGEERERGRAPVGGGAKSVRQMPEAPGEKHGVASENLLMVSPHGRLPA